MRYLLSASRSTSSRPSNQAKICENPALPRRLAHKLCNSQQQCSRSGTSFVARLQEQINYIGGMVQLQRHVHLAATVHAQVIQQNLPVSVDEAKIKSVLRANNVAFELGFTCLIMDCIFCKHKKAGRKSDGEKMYVNIITGRSCSVSHLYTRLSHCLEFLTLAFDGFSRIRKIWLNVGGRKY